MSTYFLQVSLAILFLSIIYLHMAKKNFDAAVAYGLQSFAIVMLLAHSFYETGSASLLFIAFLALGVKVILAPLFFIRLINKHELTFSVTTYLNGPLTLIGIAVLTAIATSSAFAPLTGIVPEHQALSAFSLAALFLSFFLIVNRKGALSQIIGILSIENSIVAFTLFAGLEQSAALQAGIIFDIFVWVVIATVFVSMLYRHFKTLDVTSMMHLKD